MYPVTHFGFPHTVGTTRIPREASAPMKLSCGPHLKEPLVGCTDSHWNRYRTVWTRAARIAFMSAPSSVGPGPCSMPKNSDRIDGGRGRRARRQGDERSQRHRQASHASGHVSGL